MKLRPGQHIFYRNENYIDDLELVVLDMLSSVEYRCITANLLSAKLPFDSIGNSDWFSSSLYVYLNNVFQKRIPNARHFILLTADEYHYYKNIIPKYHDSFWTRSHSAEGNYAWVIRTDGDAYREDVRNAHGVAPVVGIMKSSVEIFKDRDDKIIIQDAEDLKPII